MALRISCPWLARKRAAGSCAGLGETELIKDAALWEKWEAEFIRSEPVDFRRNLQLVEWMYEHAKALGAFDSLDPLEGIETKIRLAAVVNAPTTSGKDRSDT